VNGDNGYIAMQVSGLEVLPGAGLTDSGITPELQADEDLAKVVFDKINTYRDDLNARLLEGFFNKSEVGKKEQHFTMSLFDFLKSSFKTTK